MSWSQAKRNTRYYGPVPRDVWRESTDLDVELMRLRNSIRGKLENSATSKNALVATLGSVKLFESQTTAIFLIFRKYYERNFDLAECTLLSPFHADVLQEWVIEQKHKLRLRLTEVAEVVPGFEASHGKMFQTHWTRHILEQGKLETRASVMERTKPGRRLKSSDKTEPLSIAWGSSRAILRPGLPSLEPGVLYYAGRSEARVPVADAIVINKTTCYLLQATRSTTGHTISSNGLIGILRKLPTICENLVYVLVIPAQRQSDPPAALGEKWAKGCDAIARKRGLSIKFYVVQHIVSSADDIPTRTSDAAP